MFGRACLQAMGAHRLSLVGLDAHRAARADRAQQDDAGLLVLRRPDRDRDQALLRARQVR
jgi:hypothetical protein